MSPNNQTPEDYSSRPETLPEGQRSQQGEIWRGLGLALLLHLIQVPLVVVSYYVSLIFIGVSQLLYIVPAIFIFRGKGRNGVVKGLIIAAAITFLLNATCTVLVLGSLVIH